MRIAIGEFAHETNTFRAGVTPLADFQARHWLRGDDILARHRGVRDPLGGMIDAAERRGIALVAHARHLDRAVGDDRRRRLRPIRDELLSGIRAAGPIDALCLSLHGAGVAEGIDDVEGTLLAEIRAAVGPDLPILVTLDLHGNLTQAMVDHATVLLGCHLYPHTDLYERGVESVELAERIVAGQLRPVTQLATLPMMLPPATTMLGPAREINELCWAWEARPGVVDVAFFHGFPHTDIPSMFATVVATTDGDRDLARRAAEDVARRVWEARAAFLADLPAADAAVREALASERRPVIIAEVSDNPGGGSPGDGTHLLRALLDADPSAACFGFVYDPETAAQAHRAGVGATIDIRLGGKTDDLHGPPIEARAYVKCLTDGRFVYQTPMGRGRPVDLGAMARLVIGNVDVLVASVRTQTFDPEVFLLHGIDVARYAIVGLKSQNHFRAGFEDLAGAIIRCDPPGSTSSQLARLPFRRVLRPIWPLDPDTPPPSFT